MLRKSDNLVGIYIKHVWSDIIAHIQTQNDYREMEQRVSRIPANTQASQPGIVREDIICLIQGVRWGPILPSDLYKLALKHT